jgi:DNA polymerase III gamma/tau subunit
MKAFDIFSGQAAKEKLCSCYILLGENRGLSYQFFEKCVSLFDTNAVDIRKIENKMNVEQAEELIEESMMMPLVGGHKFYYIARADELSAIVQNKLLKTIEEPLGGSVFFLECVGEEALLPTVKSRSIKLYIEQERKNDLDCELANEIVFMLNSLQKSGEIPKFLTKPLFSKERIKDTLSISGQIFHRETAAKIKGESGFLPENFTPKVLTKIMLALTEAEKKLEVHTNATSVAETFLLEMLQIKFRG